jgi:hypothetical protein
MIGDGHLFQKIDGFSKVSIDSMTARQIQALKQFVKAGTDAFEFKGITQSSPIEKLDRFEEKRVD